MGERGIDRSGGPRRHSRLHRPYPCTATARPRWPTSTRPSARPYAATERARPGGLVHIDVKKLDGFLDGGGHKPLAARSAARTRPAPGTTYFYLHPALDDHSCLAYTGPPLPDENAAICAGFRHPRNRPVRRTRHHIRACSDRQCLDLHQDHLARHLPRPGHLPRPRRHPDPALLSCSGCEPACHQVNRTAYQESEVVNNNVAEVLSRGSRGGDFVGEKWPHLRVSSGPTSDGRLGRHNGSPGTVMSRMGPYCSRGDQQRWRSGGRGGGSLACSDWPLSDRAAGNVQRVRQHQGRVRLRVRTRPSGFLAAGLPLNVPPEEGQAWRKPWLIGAMAIPTNCTSRSAGRSRGCSLTSPTKRSGIPPGVCARPTPPLYSMWHGGAWPSTQDGPDLCTSVSAGSIGKPGGARRGSGRGTAAAPPAYRPVRSASHSA